jgi:hypothetical protein
VFESFLSRFKSTKFLCDFLFSSIRFNFNKSTFHHAISPIRKILNNLQLIFHSFKTLIKFSNNIGSPLSVQRVLKVQKSFSFISFIHLSIDILRVQYKKIIFFLSFFLINFLSVCKKRFSLYLLNFSVDVFHRERITFGQGQ